MPAPYPPGYVDLVTEIGLIEQRASEGLYTAYQAKNAAPARDLLRAKALGVLAAIHPAWSETAWRELLDRHVLARRSAIDLRFLKDTVDEPDPLVPESPPVADQITRQTAPEGLVQVAGLWLQCPHCGADVMDDFGMRTHTPDDCRIMAGDLLDCETCKKRFVAPAIFDQLGR